MASKKEFIYRVNEEKKMVYVDETVIPSKADEIAYAAYINRGFKTHKKSQKKVEQGKKMAAANKLGKKKEKAAAAKQ